MKLGIVGLPGAGKSMLFEALTKSMPIQNLSRGESRIGTIRVPDARVEFLSDLYRPKKTIYAQVEYLLPNVKGNSKEKDQNPWNEIKNCDALIHVIRNFHAAGLPDPDPLKDFNSLDEEMRFADLMVVEKRLERLDLDQKRGKNDPDEAALLGRCREMLEQEIPLRNDKELVMAPLLKGYAFVSAKPMLLLLNNNDNDPDLPSCGADINQGNALVVRGKLEYELSLVTEEEAKVFLAEFGITTSAMDRVITASYALLGLISFFTVGEDEVRAWTIRENTVATETAGVIHSDIKKGFIRAEVLAYADLIVAGSYKEARKRGTVRLEGKTYPVKDGDIIEFRFNV